jgi:hypothetical protein
MIGVKIEGNSLQLTHRGTYLRFPFLLHVREQGTFHSVDDNRMRSSRFANCSVQVLDVNAVVSDEQSQRLFVQDILAIKPVASVAKPRWRLEPKVLHGSADATASIRPFTGKHEIDIYDNVRKRPKSECVRPQIDRCFNAQSIHCTDRNQSGSPRHTVES